MAIASVFLPFLPMLPPQILFNNLLYDGSQLTLPVDNVDPEDIRLPQRLSIKQVKRFMYIFGPLSSVFDVITFVALFMVFRLSGGGFQAGWFIESLVTQIFVVYVIRTKKLPFVESRPALALIGSTLLAVIIGWSVALTNIGHAFGFGPIPALAVASVLLITVGYLVTIEIAKRLFYRFAV
jgi:Mg2+-importing ATPase